MTCQSEAGTLGDNPAPPHGFPESDWKHLRAVHRAALDRYCARVLEEIRAIIAGETGSAHGRYLRLSELLVERAGEVAAAFDDMRRSRAFDRLDAMLELGVVTNGELNGFTPRTRDAALHHAKFSQPRRKNRRK